MNAPFDTSSATPETELLAPTLLSDEDAEKFEALRHALRRELKPETAYEGLLVDDIVRLEWEARRERRWRQASLQRAYRGLGLGVFVTGELCIVHGSVNETDLADARALAGEDKAARQRAEARLNECGLSPDEVLARARQLVAHHMDIHDGRLAELEQRRCGLRNELQRRQASRGREQAEDAAFIMVERSKT